MPEPGTLPPDTPESIRDRLDRPRVPVFDASLGIAVDLPTRGRPDNRLVTIGDSLTHGFQSGAVFNTDLSWPAIVAHELGWQQYRYPRYGGPGGLPLNLEVLLRDLEARYGTDLSVWELPRALFSSRRLLDEIEDYWERGAGSAPPVFAQDVHDLAVYGWDLRDALSRTAAMCRARIAAPKDAFLSQLVENDSDRAALRVYPAAEADADLTVFDVARRLGDQSVQAEAGIETLVVFLGANNALGSVTRLSLRWSGDDYADIDGKGQYTVWTPEHFAAELALVVEQVRTIKARHVIWCTVPHVTIAPIAKGIGSKVAPGSRYFPYYTRPWISDENFSPGQDPHLTGEQARAIDYAIDAYNDGIEDVVRQARTGADGTVRDWYLLDICGHLDRLASRRYISDPNSRPSWWTPYPMPPELRALDPVPDSRFLTSDGNGGRATGGLFSLDGVHPTTIGYGLVAQEVINVMRTAGVAFGPDPDHPRPDPVQVDYTRLIRRDTLVERPPQNLSPGLEMLDWADQTLDWVQRALRFRG